MELYASSVISKSSVGISSLLSARYGTTMLLYGTTSTNATPLLKIPNLLAAPKDKSIILLRLKGPRSVTLTITSAPLAGFVTFRRVPKGKDLWAHIILSL